jgi:hypothetical protein
MPPLSTDSRGRFGRTYWWDEDDVIDRAFVVYDLLAAFRDVDATLISIWLMGFKVETASIRTAWVEVFSKHLAEYQEIAGRHGEEEAPYVMTERHAARTARQFGIKRSQIFPALIEISALIYAAAYDTTSSGEVIRDLVEKLARRWSIFRGPESESLAAISLIPADWLAGLIKYAAPSSDAVKLLEASTDAEMEVACAQWRDIWSLMVNFLPEKPSSEYISEERKLAAIVGRSIFPGLLAANSKGHTSRVWQSIELAKHALEQPLFHNLFRGYAATGRFDPIGGATWFNLVDNVLAVWGRSDLATLLSRAAPAT